MKFDELFLASIENNDMLVTLGDFEGYTVFQTRNFAYFVKDDNVHGYLENVDGELVYNKFKTQNA
jgi:hypothetical protein